MARFWSSFRTSRDLAIVGLMLLHGLRSAEVLALNRTTRCFPKHNFAFHGKGKKFRSLAAGAGNHCNCSITICDWNGPIPAPPRCSSHSKDPHAEHA